MSKELTDDELNLRGKARRRLVGAIALTLAVVVVLPMVLDSEPKPAVRDIELQIPDPDKVGQFLPGTEIVEEGVVAPASPEVAVSSPVAAPVEARPETPKTDEPKVANVIAASEAQPETAPVYAVQVGAYSNPNSARQEFDRLKKRGFKVYTEQAGTVTRVRIGPYAEREKAEKVVKILEKSGSHPSIVSAK